VGDPDTCARTLHALYEQVGGFGTLLAIGHDWPDRSVWDRSMTLLAEEVMPRLERLIGEPVAI
jgi:alkanesulfonate monooxygenase SsuD/methylene tetrahydromethanopterin reductase-like flavin-dependent oxidoreductase (luciferase family)